MLRSIQITTFFVLSFAASFGFAKTVEHVMGEGDTLWFLAQVYYGNGEAYQKIVKANKLASTEGLKNGQHLLIPEAVYMPEQPGFQVRMEHLRGKRAEALAKRVVASDSKERPVVVPRTRPKEASALPFTEIRDPAVPPRDKAKAELGGR